MLEDQLIHKLHELGAINRAPALWREQTRAEILKKIEAVSSQPFSFGERLVYGWQQMRLVLAPMHLAPVVVAALVMIIGYGPLAAALTASLPGEMLYPAKRTVEKFELSIHSSSNSQGLFYLTLAGRRLEEARAVKAASVNTQAELLRDYNITLGFAQASLETGLPSQALAKAYDQATDVLSANLNSLTVASQNRSVYNAAQDLTSKVSARALALLVSAHTSDQNGVMPVEVANRLTAEIAKVEAKLEGVDVKIKEFPTVRPAPRVVIESKAAVVPVSEASRQAKESLTEAKELIAKSEFSLALAKVQESEDLTAKSEAAVAEEEAAAEPVTDQAVEGEEPAEGAAGQGEPTVEGESTAAGTGEGADEAAPAEGSVEEQAPAAPVSP